jgi:pimeloyl-ACP methyl ester carboxylesterase
MRIVAFVLIVMTLAGISIARLATASTVPCDNFFGEPCRVSLATGIRMSYYELGARDGEPLIFLHTDSTSAVEWAWTVEALLRLNPRLHVFALDQRGSGSTTLPSTAICRSNPNRCIAPVELAADVLAFMNAKSIRAANLIGHAIGALPARLVAVEHPERVLRLILSGTGEPQPVAVGQAAARQANAFHSLDALGWQTMLEGRGVPWPAGALHLRPLDIDPDAVRHLTEHWDISAVANPEFVSIIAAQSAMQRLESWGVIDPVPAPATRMPSLSALTQPTLMLWGRADAILDLASQERAIKKLGDAAHAHVGMNFYWKQYGVTPPPATGDKHDATDIGHNLSWEAPRQVAQDIDSFIRFGRPTPDLYRTASPDDIHHIIEEPDRAIIFSGGEPVAFHQGH